MDADGQHDPADLPQLVDPIVSGTADYVQGSRYLGTYDDAGSIRDVGIRVFNHVIRAMTGEKITDCTNGYRAIKADKLALLRLEEDRFPTSEIIIEASRRGLRMQEVAVHVHSRSHGTSKKPGRLGYPIGYLRTALRTWLR
jgi:glycosyltransferase involved in cell wall biosynthesis